MSILLSLKSVPSSKLSGLGERLEIKSNGLSLNPVADIVNVTGTAVTLQPDTAYKITTTWRATTLNANPPAAGKWAYEGHAEIFVAGTGYIVTGANVVLANALEPDAVNNCVLRFRDGMCIIDVEDHVYGYIVVSTTGTTAGTLPYAISSATQDYIAFDATTNGSTINLSGSTANGVKHIVGNGSSGTTLTGAVNCGTSKFTVANLTLDNVQVTGGTMTLGDAFIPSGSTVAAVSGGWLAVEKVTGAGSESVIDLVGTKIEVPKGTPARADGVTFLGGDSAGCFRLVYSGGVVSAANCTFRNNKSLVTYYQDAKASFTSCTFEDKVGSSAYYIYTSSTKQNLELNACTFKNTAGNINLAGTAKCLMTGSNVIETIVSGTAGTVVNITSGAIVDLTGNTNTTPIFPGGGIVVSGGCTVINSAGSSVNIAGGTYTKINKDGTTA